MVARGDETSNRQGGAKRVQTMHDKKLVWNKLSQGMAVGGYLRSALQYIVKVNNLKQ